MEEEIFWVCMGSKHGLKTLAINVYRKQAISSAFFFDLQLGSQSGL
jgi:hypothetical protein